MLLELIQKNWHLFKPEDGKQKCTKSVWAEIGDELKKAGYRTKIEDKHHGQGCSQKWSNLQKCYKRQRAAEKRSRAPSSEFWVFDAQIEALLHEFQNVLIFNNMCVWLFLSTHLFPKLS